jgi:hypothetical protein
LPPALPALPEARQEARQEERRQLLAEAARRERSWTAQ